MSFQSDCISIFRILVSTVKLMIFIFLALLLLPVLLFVILFGGSAVTFSLFRPFRDPSFTRGKKKNDGALHTTRSYDNGDPIDVEATVVSSEEKGTYHSENER